MKSILASCALVLGVSVAVLGCANKPSAHECASGIVCPDPLQCAAVQAVCISNNCGNGIVDTGEVCDDGNIVDGDGCSKDCKSKEECGDGVMNTEAGEVCDDGNTIAGDGCSANCRSNEVCGNSITDSAKGEICDDGNTHNGKCGDDKPCDSNADCTVGSCTPDGCSSDCKSSEVCGNGIKDLGEVCDDGGAAGGCENDCQHGIGCGNGVLDPGEDCDDGDSTDTNDCKNNCKFNICGDGVLDSSGTSHHEDCDPGSGGVPLETAGCNLDCSTPTCGDGKVNKHFKPDGMNVEQCDLGTIAAVNQNQDDRDCTQHCLLNVCNDGHQNTAGTLANREACDDGNQVQNDGCTTECTVPAGACGNGIVDMGEECDLGSTTMGVSKNTLTSLCPACKIAKCGDGNVSPNETCDPGMAGEDANCNFDCTAPSCGDGYVNVHFTPTGGPGVEQCDNGAANSDTGACTSKCRIATCGDGKVQTNVEQCDTGGASATCDADCTNPVCGDGVTNPNFKPDGTLVEQCDHGVNNGKIGDTCDFKCRTAGCGNGIVETDEDCDTGGASATCDADCSLPVCGDGVINPNFKPDGTNVEQCDDRTNNTNDNRCPYNTSCLNRCSTTCQTIVPVKPICGDNFIDGGHETCDDGNTTNAVTECAYPSAAACQACHACALVVFAPQYCGDSTVQATHGETCDPPGVGNCRASCTSCTDTAQNGGESDLNCGHLGGCGLCIDGKKCIVAADCTSAVCDGTNHCAVPSCSDGVKNGLETDQDCGGTLCDMAFATKCADTLGCQVAADCQSGICDGTNHCAVPTCTDLVKNDGEAQVDCGGTSVCGGCAGDPCAVAGDCHSASCTMSLCD